MNYVRGSSVYKILTIEVAVEISAEDDAKSRITQAMGLAMEADALDDWRFLDDIEAITDTDDRELDDEFFDHEVFGLERR